jgi:lysophospholipase L1-like esterase
VRGSGYTRGLSTFDQRVDRAAATHSDVLVVEGSLNERTTPTDQLATAAAATFAHLRARADPKTRILIVGATYSPGTPDATIDSINAVVRAAAERSGLRFVDPATENWIDAGKASLWHDPDHPDDVGYQVVADRLEPVLRALVEG